MKQDQLARIQRNRLAAENPPVTLPLSPGLKREETPLKSHLAQGGTTGGWLTPSPHLKELFTIFASPGREWQDRTPRKFTNALLLFCLLWHSGCAVSQQLSRGKAREKIQELGLIQLADQEIQVKEIVQSGDDQAVAQINLNMAFRLSRAKGGDWQVNALRLGDRNWLDMKAFISALNEVRLRETRESLAKLLNAMKLFRQKRGEYPRAANIVALTDILVPEFMSEMIRYDGWNRELITNSASPDSFQLISLGADGVRGTADDIVMTP